MNVANKVYKLIIFIIWVKILLIFILMIILFIYLKIN